MAHRIARPRADRNPAVGFLLAAEGFTMRGASARAEHVRALGIAVNEARRLDADAAVGVVIEAADLIVRYGPSETRIAALEEALDRQRADYREREASRYYWNRAAFA